MKKFKNKRNVLTSPAFTLVILSMGIVSFKGTLSKVVEEIGAFL